MMIVTLSAIQFLLNLIKISNLMEESHYNTIIILKKLQIGKTNCFKIDHNITKRIYNASIRRYFNT